MTIQEFSDRVKAVKVKETELLFRDAAGNSYSVAGMFYGVKGENNVIAHPQIGDEPNCAIVQITPIV